MASARAKVQVHDTSGRPVAGAVVTVEDGTAPFPELAFVSNGDGRVSLALPAGRFAIAVVDPDSGRRGSASVDTSSGSAIVTVIIE